MAQEQKKTKKLHKLTLNGIVKEAKGPGRMAKTQDADCVWYYGGREGESVVKAYFKGKGHNRKLRLVTSGYPRPITLSKHATQGYWYGNLPNGVKVQINVLKIVAHMRYWA